MFFRSKKPQLTPQQSQAGRPVRVVEAEVEPTADGGAKLKVRVRPARWARWLMRGTTTLAKTFELDALGMLVWNSCDGKTSVQQIIRRLAKQYNLTLREAEVGTVKFLQMLIKKGLIAMVVKEKPEAKDS